MELVSKESVEICTKLERMSFMHWISLFFLPSGSHQSDRHQQSPAAVLPATVWGERARGRSARHRGATPERHRSGREEQTDIHVAEQHRPVQPAQVPPGPGNRSAVHSRGAWPWGHAPAHAHCHGTSLCMCVCVCAQTSKSFLRKCGYTAVCTHL